MRFDGSCGVPAARCRGGDALRWWRLSVRTLSPWCAFAAQQEIDSVAGFDGNPLIGGLSSLASSVSIFVSPGEGGGLTKKGRDGNSRAVSKGGFPSKPATNPSWRAFNRRFPIGSCREWRQGVLCQVTVSSNRRKRFVRGRAAGRSRSTMESRRRKRR